MLHPNGDIFVPPNCPQHHEGPPIPDLRTADFHMGVLTSFNRPNPVVEAYGSFIIGDPEEDDSCSRVDTETIVEAADSPLAKRLLAKH